MVMILNCIIYPLLNNISLCEFVAGVKYQFKITISIESLHDYKARKKQNYGTCFKKQTKMWYIIATEIKQ